MNLRWQSDAKEIKVTEVPAGPGDAGRADRAELLPGVKFKRAEGRQAMVAFALLTIAGLMAILLLSTAS